MRDGGKGDAPRPIKNREQFENNWDAIFKKAKDNDKERQEPNEADDSSGKVQLSDIRASDSTQQAENQRDD